MDLVLFISSLLLNNDAGIRSINSFRDDTALFYVLICCLGVLAFVKWKFPNEMDMYSKSFRNAVLAKRYHTQKLMGFSLPLFLLLGLSSVIFGLLGYNYFRFTPLELDFVSPVFLLLFFLLVSAGLIAVRCIFYALAALIFSKTDVIFFYLKNVIIHTIYLGLCLCPIALLLSFNHTINREYLWMGALMVILAFVSMRVFRSWIIVQPILMSHKLYFFIYFCTLEILPLLMLLKFSGILKMGV